MSSPSIPKNPDPATLDSNVLLELVPRGAVSEEVLDANSDDVLDAVKTYASKFALGPTISLNLADHAIRLRFDVLAESEAEVHRKVAELLEVIERHTDLKIVRSSSVTERAPDDDDAAVCA